MFRQTFWAFVKIVRCSFHGKIRVRREVASNEPSPSGEHPTCKLQCAEHELSKVYPTPPDLIKRTQATGASNCCTKRPGPGHSARKSNYRCIGGCSYLSSTLDNLSRCLCISSAPNHKAKPLSRAAERELLSTGLDSVPAWWKSRTMIDKLLACCFAPLSTTLPFVVVFLCHAHLSDRHHTAPMRLSLQTLSLVGALATQFFLRTANLTSQ